MTHFRKEYYLPILSNSTMPCFQNLTQQMNNVVPNINYTLQRKKTKKQQPFAINTPLSHINFAQNFQVKNQYNTHHCAA